jgi:site-specific DNA recombinase
VVRQIFSMILDGKTLSDVAKSLNEAGITTKSGLVWCATTVRRTVTNPIYAGETYYGRRKRTGKTKIQFQDREKWVLLPDVTPAIVTKTTFDAAQEAIKRKYRPLRDNPSDYFLTGFMFCPECGSPVCGATLNRKYRYYRCRGTTPTRTRGSICDTPYIKADEVETYVWDRLVELTQSPGTILFTLLDKHYDSSSQEPAALIPAIDKQIKALHTKLKTYGPKEQNLIHLYAEDQITKEYLLAEVKRIREREAEDKRHIDQLLKTRREAATANKITLKLSEYSDKLRASLPQSLTPQAKREFLDTYGVKVLAARGKYAFCCFADMILTSCEYDEEFEAAFSQGLEQFEKQHPEITLQDLMDYGKVLPEDHLFARYINETKKRQKSLRAPKTTQSSTNRSFTTIERTSA